MFRISIPDIILLIFIFTFTQVDYHFTVRVGQVHKHLQIPSVKNLQFMQRSWIVQMQWLMETWWGDSNPYAFFICFCVNKITRCWILESCWSMKILTDLICYCHVVKLSLWMASVWNTSTIAAICLFEYSFFLGIALALKLCSLLLREIYRLEITVSCL